MSLESEKCQGLARDKANLPGTEQKRLEISRTISVRAYLEEFRTMLSQFSVTASFDDLLRQASMTASDYLGAAIRSIDGRFGEGYAESHPELVAAFMRVASDDFRTSSTLKIVERVAVELGNILSDVVGSL